MSSSSSMLTIDFFIHITTILFFNPVLATLLPISFYFSTDLATSSLQFRISLVYSILLWSCQCLSILNRSIRRGSLSPPRRLTWADQIVIVTGGASGLGHALISIMAMNRAKVISLDIESPKNPIQGVEYLSCDVSSIDQITALESTIINKIGHPTVVMSNAAVLRPGSILETDISLIDLSLNVNFRSNYLLVKSFLPGMLQPGGHWVTISSSLGYVGVPGISGYCASKAATISFHESLTAELRALKSPVSTTLVVPGQLDSELFNGLKNPSQFLAPTVEVLELAKRIVKYLEDGGGGEFGMPWYANWIGIMGVVPSGLQVLLRMMSGMDQAAMQLASNKQTQSGITKKRY